MRSPKTIAKEAMSSRTALGVGFGLGLWVSIAVGLYGYFGAEDNLIRLSLRSQDHIELHTEVENLRTENREIKDELDRNRALADLDKETNSKLKVLINNLETENGKLKQDLAFFETFVPSSDNNLVNLKRLQVTKDSLPNQFRYKALVIQGSDKPPVKLDVQIVVKLTQAGKPSVMVLPGQMHANDSQFKLELQRFARLDGMFVIPANAKLLSVEIRLQGEGAIKASASIKL
ncbi:MAG: hypothetical protein QE278_09750 [Limnobacter sp.]|nr:hypothetical protein [Limnobacter sp.]